MCKQRLVQIQERVKYQRELIEFQRTGDKECLSVEVADNCKKCYGRGYTGKLQNGLYVICSCVLKKIESKIDKELNKVERR